MTQDQPTPSEQLMRLLAYLQRDPENDRLRGDIFERALSMGAFDEAGLQMAHARKTRPDDTAWKHREAMLYLACGQYDLARNSLVDLLQTGHDAPGTRYNLAYALFGMGIYAEARDMVAPLREASAETAALAWSLWLRCQHHLYQLEEGLKAFTEALPLSPMGADAFGVASLMAIDANRPQDAQTWADHALAENPEQLEALVASGTLATGKQQPQLAQRQFEHALRLNENDGRSWSGMAFAKMVQMDLAAALEAFQRAVTHMPNHIGTWIGYGWCRLFVNDLAGCRSAFEQALALDRNFSESHGAMAVILARLNEREAAQREVDIALKLDPRSLSVRYAQALLNGEASDPEAFHRMAQRVLSQHPGLIEGQTLADVVLKRRK